MRLSEIKKHLSTAVEVNFQLSNGMFVPEHFHVTEVGIINKDFIDCGGRIRNEKVASFQLWNANDTEHRLKPQKLMNIIALCEKKLPMEDLEIEVEYQSDTIGKYGLDFIGKNFILTTKKTDCLAKDTCGAPKEIVTSGFIESKQTSTCCTSGGGCC